MGFPTETFGFCWFVYIHGTIWCGEYESDETRNGQRVSAERGSKAAEKQFLGVANQRRTSEREKAIDGCLV